MIHHGLKNLQQVKKKLLTATRRVRDEIKEFIMTLPDIISTAKYV
jgi:hypothetical protein